MNVETNKSIKPEAVLLSQPAKTDRQEIIAEVLTEDERDEILDFLANRPPHGVIMAGWILDRGVISTKHRGQFYGCRNSLGQLEGVGLIGRTTMFETRTERAAAALGEVARQLGTLETVFAEPEPLNTFWNSFAWPSLQPRLKCTALLYECAAPFCAVPATQELRLATTDELDQITSAHAEMVREETGIDPLQKDRHGFRERCLDRIKANRVWISTQQGQVIFKADIVTETPQVVYLEGMWISPNLRGQRLGRCFLGALGKAVALRGRSVSFFVNQENGPAARLYASLGCRPIAVYQKYIL
jgi:hypothetical protein